MQRVLEPSQVAATRKALNGPESESLLDLIFRLNCEGPVEPAHVAALQLARELGWVEEQRPKLTKLGFLVSDPIREYRFWMERDRRLHSQNEYALLGRDFYRGKSVLEIGSGFGCNLFSLTGMDGRFVGVEPIAIYRQFTPILAEREGIEPPTVVDGKGEALPFGADEFDVVFCYSADQYMDIKQALREMARVVKPGGQLQIVGGTLGCFLSFVFSTRGEWTHFRSAKTHALTVLNTLSYCLGGKRVYTPRGDTATTAPIYPPQRSMNAWLAQAGLVAHRDLFRWVRGDACFIATKPQLQSARVSEFASSAEALRA
jgi:SAM-dependent methyltransferase